MSKDFGNGNDMPTEENGYYDENGNWVDTEGGYYDENGNWVEVSGYYDENGIWIETGSYVDENGERVEYCGYYDGDGNWIDCSANSSYYEDDGEYDDFEEIIDDSQYSKSRKNGNDQTLRAGNVRRQEKERMQLPERGGKKKHSVGAVVGKVVLVLVTFLLVTLGGAYFTMRTICYGPSEAAKQLFVSTFMETGQLKFIPKLYFSEEEITNITSSNSMGHLDADVDTGLIQIPNDTPSDTDEVEGEDVVPFDIDGMELVELTGRTYYAKMLVINDPSRVKLASLYSENGSWGTYGQTLDYFAGMGDYIAAVNGGEYESSGNQGGMPKGLVVCDGEIQFNRPAPGDVMVGFNTDNILIVRDIGSMSAESVKSLVTELNIRDAVTFKDIDDGDENHFTKLIINGEATPLVGSGSGANPRTAIGQKADGTVLILVTDGRGSGGHLGATAADLISIMQEYGAVNAANLDGGSSSSMYYDGEYEMTSVTLYYANASWRLPVAFVVERRD